MRLASTYKSDRFPEAMAARRCSVLPLQRHFYTGAQADFG
jgi:hypothetical protein